jgi:EAL and modified HD-GYP domain-containing signal transduction protein
MQDENFIVRQPLLNAQERALGYELSWQGKDAPNELDAKVLMLVVGEQTSASGGDFLLGDQLLFLAAPLVSLTNADLSRLPSQEVVFALNASELPAANGGDVLKVLRDQGFGLSLRGADIAAVDKNLLPQFTHIEISANAADFDAQVQFYRSQNLPSAMRLIARDVSGWEQFDRCASLDMDVFAGEFRLTRRPDARSGGLNPAQAMIVQLMDMVTRGVDVKQLEGVLKRDPALAYKLLRYINSAGFGLGFEVQSLRHAVTLLGYSPLYRWLALLLATATTTGYSPVLMQTAVVRGRFAELLGQTFLPKNEAENLFVAGMFSLLDKLLGVSMEDVLSKVQLSETVTEALLSRQGMYGPFLALAEACESGDTDVESMAMNLCISPLQVNKAHLAALAWVQGLKL